MEDEEHLSSDLGEYEMKRYIQLNATMDMLNNKGVLGLVS